MSLRLTARSPVINAGIQKKKYELGITTLVTSVEEIHDITEIFKSLEGLGILLKSITQTIKNETKTQRT